MSSVICINTSSNGAKVIRERTGVLRVAPNRIRRNGSRYVINWGVHNEPIVKRSSQIVLNPVEAVRVSANKITMLQKLREAGVAVPDFDTDLSALRSRHPRDRIIARHTVTGQGGAGIEVIERNDQPSSSAPLYVHYFPKTWEVRLHVWRDEIILTQQKYVPQDLQSEDRTTEQRVVRSYNNGWRFKSSNFTYPIALNQSLANLGVTVVQALGLDFGAVDVMIHENNTLMVCEVNTRPGLDSEASISAYATKIEGL